jgi:CubicO group peptidase (beta-lactamase class C family)
MGREMADYMQERIFDPIGIEHLSWDVQGGSGFMGPHTNAHTGILVSSRELARFGYLMLQRGKWKDEQLIPEWWIDLATDKSQDLNPGYGFTWWINPESEIWPNLPSDTFCLAGHRDNWCFIIPSLDMVIVRTGTGPSLPDYMPVDRIVSAVID